MENKCEYCKSWYTCEDKVHPDVACPNFENIYNTYPARQGETIDEKCKRILSHYGTSHQLGKVAEELVELLSEVLISKKCVEISNGPIKYFNRDNMLSEIADTYVVLNYLRYIFHFSEMTIQEEIERKVNRQLERMKDERPSN